jgi:hypothetical protein
LVRFFLGEANMTSLKWKLACLALFIVSTSPVPAMSQNCISHRIEGRTIILQNTCNQYVSWSMCLNVADRSFKDYPAGVIAPHGYSQYGVFSNAAFSYHFNQCVGKGCHPAAPSCNSVPQQKQGQQFQRNVQSFIQGFASAYAATHAYTPSYTTPSRPQPSVRHPSPTTQQYRAASTKSQLSSSPSSSLACPCRTVQGTCRLDASGRPASNC